MLFATMDPDIDITSIAGGLGVFYLLLAAMNGVLAMHLWRKQNRPQAALVWTVVALIFVIMAPLALSGDPNWVPQRPLWLKDVSMLLSGKAGAIVYSLGTTIMLVVLYIFR